MKVYIFKLYERLWHWIQGFLVLGLLWMGMVIHGVLSWPSFSVAVAVHETLGLLLIFLIAVTFVWYIITGDIKQFVPQSRGVADMVRFYASGVFRNERHPMVTRPEDKLNPLQRAAYFGLLLFIFPVGLGTGLLLWSMPRYESLSFLHPFVALIAMIHTGSAFGMAIFILVHLYMITFGRTLWANLKTMITGWADVDPLPRPPAEWAEALKRKKNSDDDPPLNK